MKYLKLFEDYLNEVGDLSAGNYPVTGPLFDAGGTRYCKYIFKTDSGLEYTVVFYVRRGAVVECWFEVRDEGNDKIRPQHLTTDKGELYKIMGTIVPIVNHYLTAKGAGTPYGLNSEFTPKDIHAPEAEELVIEPSKEKKRVGRGYGDDIKSDKRREKLYMTYLKKQGYKTRMAGDTISVDIKKYKNVYESVLNEKKPKGAPDFHHSDAPDAEGRFRDLSAKDLAAWLIKTRNKDVQKISAALNQQIVFHRGKDKAYADKMERTRKEVYKKLDRKDLLDKMNEALNESKVSYSAVVLDKKSKEKLLNMGTMQDGWEPAATHMTINTGQLSDPSMKGKTIKLEVIEAAENEQVVAAKVAILDPTLQVRNRTPHIVIALNKKKGGKLSMGKSLEGWVKVRSIILSGEIKEIPV